MANVFSQERTVEEYREAIERMKGEYDIAVRNYRKAQEEFEEYQEQLRAFDEDLREAQISFAAEEQRLDKAVGKCEELNAALILRTAARDSVRPRQRDQTEGRIGGAGTIRQKITKKKKKTKKKK